jgi:CsoR family transcriptional regulator, copper-sensing transcriptional repressor
MNPITHGYIQADNKDAMIKRLHSIEGQVRGSERMVDDERYRIDILTQIGAVSTALESLAQKLLEDHANHCVAGALADGNCEDAETETRELLGAVHRFIPTR